MTLVWAETRDPLLEQRVAETIGWILREMRMAGGAFASSLDADSEGEEGRFYVWTEAEVDRLLGRNGGLFKEVYDVRPAGNWEGHTILNRSASGPLRDEATEGRLAEDRARLLEARAARVRPGLDDKILADWNGLMIAALARAGFAFSRPGWIEAARAALDFVTAEMTRDGRLLHAWCDGRAAHPATLDDYANLSRAAIALFEATGDEALLGRAKDWAAILDRHYWDPAEGAYFLAADDTDDLITRTKSASDQSVPSGNGVMAEVLVRLHHHTGEAAYAERAEATFAALSGELGRNVFPLATLLNAADLADRPLQVVLAGEAGARRPLADAVRAVSLPNRILRLLDPGARLPTGHPARGKAEVEGRAAAFVCEGPVCSLPLTDAADLRDRLAGGAGG